MLLAAFALPGCMIFFDDGGKRPPICDLAEPASLPAPLRNPEALTCDQLGGGCNPECGPCAETTKGGAQDLAPLPTWGTCGSSCETLTEGACAANAECRVVKDARCAIGGDCATDFVGCFPIDNAPDPTVDCFAARDGWTCSRSAACTALHRTDFACQARDSAQCERPFALCIEEGKDPGRCESAACDRAPPNCPSGTVPGVATGCYTNACIPLALCDVAI